MLRNSILRPDRHINHFHDLKHGIRNLRGDRL